MRSLYGENRMKAFLDLRFCSKWPTEENDIHWQIPIVRLSVAAQVRHEQYHIEAYMEAARASLVV